MIVPTSWPRVLTAFGVGSTLIIGLSQIGWDAEWEPLAPFQRWLDVADDKTAIPALLTISVLFATYVVGEIILAVAGLLPKGTLRARSVVPRLRRLEQITSEAVRDYYRATINRIEALQGFGISFSLFLILSLLNSGLPFSHVSALVIVFIVMFVGVFAFIISDILWEQLDKVLQSPLGSDDIDNFDEP